MTYSVSATRRTRSGSAAKSAERSSGETTETSGGAFFTAGISPKAPRMSEISFAGRPSALGGLEECFAAGGQSLVDRGSRACAAQLVDVRGESFDGHLLAALQEGL